MKQIGKKKRLRKILLVLMAAVLILGAAFTIYVEDYYRADQTALSGLEQPAEGITIEKEKNGDIIFLPSDPNDIEKGLVFYPGGKVEYLSYVPLMTRLAEEGIACILVKVPCNLAILDIGAADGLQELVPEVKEWYIGGHSLGGVCAAMYLGKHTGQYQGLILMGAYSTVDFSDTGLHVLCMYGENDGVMNRDKYEEDKKNLPDDFTEYIIPGGCHAYFGSYGSQKGDGQPSITADRQQEEAAEEILTRMENAEQ